jgi:UvrD/REP helicase N-terminal domain/UvrD-like helicase C-terminal domain
MVPTPEQQLAIEKFRTTNPLKISAFAGSGKTTTLKMLAEASPSRRGVYLAFNRAIAAEARGKFPRSVDCRTTHAIAFRSVMPRYGSTAKMTARLHAKQLSTVLAYGDRIFPGTFRLNGVHQAHLVLTTLRRYCQSANENIGLQHVPRYGRLLGAREEIIGEIRTWTVAEASALWQRMVNRGDDLPLGHDGYLKLWALSRPKLNVDYILLDEAQDTNEVVLGVLAGQQGQVVYVGDKHQQIYEWRGAVNAMDRVSGCEEAALTQSFRFGSAIATAASRVLATLGELRPIQGNPQVNSTIIESGRADAMLARTNATVILEILEAINSGWKPCVCGGTQEISRLLSDVFELKSGKPAVSPEFFGFQNWAEVVEFANSEEGESLRTFVQLVEQHGERKLWAAVKKAVAEENAADVILSTAHKAKGREWDRVRLAPDFMTARLGPDAAAESEVRLFYVAMTRAKRSLIAGSELLRIFTTDAWKTKRPEEGRPSSSTAGARTGPQARPRPAPQAPIREINPDERRMQHPGAATPTRATEPREHSTTPVTPPVPPPPPPTWRAEQPRAIWEDATVRHPGTAAGYGSQPERSSGSGRRGIWRWLFGR